MGAWSVHQGFARRAVWHRVSHKRVISMAELTAYMKKHLSQLTGGDQQLGLDLRFQGDIFVAGM